MPAPTRGRGWFPFPSALFQCLLLLQKVGFFPVSGATSPHLLIHLSFPSWGPAHVHLFCSPSFPHSVSKPGLFSSCPGFTARQVTVTAVTLGPALLRFPSFLPRAPVGTHTHTDSLIKLLLIYDRSELFKLSAQHLQESPQRRQKRAINPSLTCKREFSVSERPADPG